jgi:hypothetical protein
MTTDQPNHAIYVLLGIGAWLMSTALLHWLPVPISFDPRFTPMMAGFALANCAFFAAVVYLVIRRKPEAQRFAVCAAIVMPGAFGDAIAMAFFSDFFPKLDAAGSNMFAAFLLLTYAVILATGLFAGRLRSGASLNGRPGNP